MKTMNLAALALPILLAVGCAKPKASPCDYTKFRSEDPGSILVVPAVNKSVDVTAPDYLLSTLTRPLAERGYYVFPVYLVKRVMEDDGLADASLVHGSDPRRLAALFGADAVLYVSIERWDAKYAVLSTSVEVEFNYVLKSGKTGEELWRNHQAWTYTPQNQSGGSPLASLVAAAVNAAMTKAAPNYMPLANQANRSAFGRLHTGLPAGPHQELHTKDREDF
jgi:hypothetical protein